MVNASSTSVAYVNSRDDSQREVPATRTERRTIVNPYNRDKTCKILTSLEKVVIHVGKIVPDQVYLNFDPTCSRDRQRLANISNVDLQNKDRKAVISLHHKMIIITTEKQFSQRWKVIHITVDFQRFVFGHTGRTLDAFDCFILALTLYITTLNLYVAEDSKDRGLPGLVENCCSYWSSLEICTQIKDEEGLMLELFSKARHKSVKKGKVVYDGESVTFQGSEFKFIVYLKCRQLEEKYHHHVPDDQKNVLRLEARFSKKKLVRSFAGDTDNPDSCRLVSFNLGDVYAAFRMAVSGIEGVFHDAPAVKLDAIEKFVFNLVSGKHTQLSPKELIDLYAEGGTCGKDYKPRKVSRVLKALEASKNLKMQEIVPDSIPESAQIHPLRKIRDAQGDYTGKMESIPGNLHEAACPKVAEAYSVKRFIPYQWFKHSDELGRPHPDSVRDKSVTPDGELHGDNPQPGQFPAPPAPPSFPIPPKPC